MPGGLRVHVPGAYGDPSGEAAGAHAIIAHVPVKGETMGITDWSKLRNGGDYLIDDIPGDGNELLLRPLRPGLRVESGEVLVLMLLQNSPTGS